jgi:hypothetical protein
MMTLDEILQDIHALETDLTTYERKYGILSEIFYESYTEGEEPTDDNWVLDWTRWASAYQIWLRRHEQYRQAIKSLQRNATLSEIIEKRAQYDPLPISS